MARSNPAPSRVLAILCVAGAFGSGCASRLSVDPSVVAYYGLRSRGFLASPEATREGVRAVLASLDYEIVRDEPSLLVGRSPAETRFFAMMGEQTKHRVVEISLAAGTPGRTRVDLASEIVHGAATSERLSRRSDADEDFCEDFFERLHGVLRVTGAVPSE